MAHVIRNKKHEPEPEPQLEEEIPAEPQKEPEPVIEPEVEPEPEPEPPKKPDAPQVQLRNFIPVDLETAETEAIAAIGRELSSDQRYELEQIIAEDWQRGFRLLSPSQMREHGISENPDCYRSMKAIAVNYLGVSSTTAGKYFKDISKLGFPPGYLGDKYGYTPEAVYELLKFVEYTRPYLFPNKENKEENPNYKLRFNYWEEATWRCNQWRTWREQHQSSGYRKTETKFGELAVIPTYEGGEAALIQRIEMGDQSILASVDFLGEKIYESMRPFVREVGLKIRAQISEDISAIVNDPHAGEPKDIE